MAAHGPAAPPDPDSSDALTTPYLSSAADHQASAAASLPSPTSPSWKHIFRLGSGAGGRKPNRSKSTLTLDTEFAAAASNTTAASALENANIVSTLGAAYGPSATQLRGKSSVGDGDVQVSVIPSALTPSSSVSFNRYSSYSTGTASSGESGLGAAYGSQSSGSRQYAHPGPPLVNGQSVPPSSSTARGQGWPQSQPNTPDASQFQSMNQSSAGFLPTPSSSAGQERVKSSKSSQKLEKKRSNGQQHAPPLTAVSPVPPSPGLMSPKGGAPKSGMTKFIRRVASAPNAKGFFTLSRSHRDRDPNTSAGLNGLRTPTSIKGFGFLSPSLSSGAGGGRNDTVPEVPPIPNSGGSQRISGQGTDSLETASSGSSHGRVMYSGQQRQSSRGLRTTPPPSYQAPHGIANTLSHSQSASNLLSPSQGSLLSPSKGGRPARANSSASFSGPLKGLKGKKQRTAFPYRFAERPTSACGYWVGWDGARALPTHVFQQFDQST